MFFFGLALLCLIIALVAGAFGEGSVKEISLQGAKLFALLGVVFVLIGILFGWPLIWPVTFR